MSNTVDMTQVEKYFPQLVRADKLGRLSTTIRDDAHNDDFKKTIDYYQNNNSARASHFLIHFFDVHCTTTTWNLLICRFMEDVNIRRRILLPLFEPE